MAVFKPVLYFHTPAPQTLRSVVVHAAEGGSPRSGHRTVRSDGPLGKCGHRGMVRAHVAQRDRCTVYGPAHGRLLRERGAAVARTSDAACVTVGAAVELFLFYRAHSFHATARLGGLMDAATCASRTQMPADPGLLVRLRWRSLVRRLRFAARARCVDRGRCAVRLAPIRPFPSTES